jgi:hypothetical protein
MCFLSKNFAPLLAGLTLRDTVLIKTSKSEVKELGVLITLHHDLVLVFGRVRTHETASSWKVTACLKVTACFCKKTGTNEKKNYQ